MLSRLQGNNGRRRAAGKHLLLPKDVLVNLVERNARHVVANGKIDREDPVPEAQHNCRILLVICGWINLVPFCH